MCVTRSAVTARSPCSYCFIRVSSLATMAASREGPLKIHLVHGAKNHFLTLSLQPDDCSDVVGFQHLTAKAEEITGIPPEKQRLIHKGKTLTASNDKGLRALGLKDGAKIMLLGSKPSASPNQSAPSASNAGPQGSSQLLGNSNVGAEPSDPYKEDMDKLLDVQGALSHEADRLHDTILELEDFNAISQRNGKTDLSQLEQLKKKLMASSEVFMRLLERLDSLRFNSSDASSRGKRKAMVDQIQRLMDQCEELSSSIKKKLASSK